MTYERLILEKKDGIARIIFNSPEKLNAMDRKLRTELFRALREAEEDGQPARSNNHQGEPNVVMASLSLQGQTGPCARIPGGGTGVKGLAGYVDSKEH